MVLVNYFRKVIILLYFFFSTVKDLILNSCLLVIKQGWNLKFINVNTSSTHSAEYKIYIESIFHVIQFCIFFLLNKLPLHLKKEEVDLCRKLQQTGPFILPLQHHNPKWEPATAPPPPPS